MLFTLQHLSFMKRRSIYELYNRAWLYVIRKKGKSILLSIILLLIATFVLTALAIGNASETARQNLRQSLGGNFLIATDYSDINPYLKVEE